MMPPSVSKEHLIRESEHPLWGLTGFEINEDNARRVSERIWDFLNSKLFNVVIIILVLIEGLVIFAELLINLDIIQDPEWRKSFNCVHKNDSSETETQISPHLLRIKDNLSQTSLVILSLFLIEIIFRIFSGKLNFVVQPLEIFDLIVVFVVFILQEKESILIKSRKEERKASNGEEAALLIILLRLWRVCKLIQSIIDESQQKLLQLLHICEKEKAHAEHKIDILILKVEDLEHEVAYLKEKLKKADKESSMIINQLSSVVNKRETARRTESTQSNSSSSTSYCPCQRAGVIQAIVTHSSSSSPSPPPEPQQQQQQRQQKSVHSVATIEIGPKKRSMSVDSDLGTTAITITPFSKSDDEDG